MHTNAERQGRLKAEAVNSLVALRAKNIRKAETAALLVLRKKARAIWEGTEEE
ncbi:MAG: hypothetical protein KZQ66_10285 [Candidatus Thiodiazotropha sp. (ex Lucinoma aequizonata)]|nr:hypothetical protein [Candidatus Thiodiazotropha sp. (ex Lucinoma aequizonata)]MCU7888016.1 hypothetical protein [Candidatus Thiodiazotropha sp. (ex Lucinoma aequizonata)]MCU7895228.1 hypothetical protein [Candidatus Thiodiazotropha sp. (ex Lucinoma aequizonata)]MCU7897969.1 hypothetical protein [Candidatus Thiodiazotropha sp. (ex Lucinoma aequizonata)]MCU7902326.1 hypothetical protein [Candidatus Thiodiazotropha sp. (ex Lucinoma aequizonata)]